MGSAVNGDNEFMVWVLRGLGTITILIFLNLFFGSLFGSHFPQRQPLRIVVGREGNDGG